MATDYWGLLENQLRRAKRLLLLGEMHGAEANPKVIDAFVRRLKIQVVMIELETKWREIFPLLAHGRAKEFAKRLRREEWLCRSGVIGQRHVRLFRQYLREGKRIIPVKIEHPDWNVAERKTAKTIRQLLKKYPREKVLVVMGNLHTRKKPFTLYEKKHRKRLVPLGALLNRDIISVRIRYGRGRIYNFRFLSLRDPYALRHCRNKGGGLTRSRSRYFDYDYIISKTKPLQLL